MASHPLTHHEMFGLIEPFARRGLRVDAAATDRLARRIVFAPQSRPATAALPELKETLELDCDRIAGYTLLRTLTTSEGLAARLEVTGEQPETLLERQASIPASTQFERHEGVWVGFSHRLGEDGALRLSAGEARIDGLALTLTAPTMRGLAADIELTPVANDRFALPADLFAVLGWRWSTLRARDGQWTAQLTLRGNDARRDRGARQCLGVAAAHLKRTLAEPPARFHERFLRRRFIAAFRRTTPLLVALLLLATAAVIPHLALWQNSLMRMMIFQVPPLLMMLFFCLREIPRFEIPPLPRAPPAASWRALPDRPVAAQHGDRLPSA